MRGRTILFLAVNLVLLLFSSSVQASSGLSFVEAAHMEPAYNRGDEIANYRIRLKNSGTSETNGTTTVLIGLPAGVKLSGSGQISGAWNCNLAANACSSNQVIGSDGEFPTLNLRVTLDPATAPDVLVAEFTASGGGAPTSTVATDTIVLDPERLFEIEGLLSAATCSEPGQPVDSSICSSAFGSGEFTVAGAHPYAATSVLDLPTHTSPVGLPSPVESMRDLYFELPAGFIANPESATICTFMKVQNGECPDSAVIGGTKVVVSQGFDDPPAPIYRIQPEEGYPAAFAFRPVALSSLTFVLRAKLRANGDYGVTAVSPLAPQAPAFLRVDSATLCGYGPVLSASSAGFNPFFLGCKKPGDPGARAVPALTNPTSCVGAPPTTRVHVDSYQHLGLQDDEGFPDLSDSNWKSAEAVASPNGDCGTLTEAWTSISRPSLSFQPGTDQAGAPAAFSAHLHVPQDGLLEADARANPHLKDTTVTLPQGIALNPSAADGLQACSEQQAGYLGNGFGYPNPMRFKTTSSGCPEDSKVGTATVKTPILGDPLEGAIYLAAQDQNPFGARFAVYLVIDDEKTGIKATLPGKVDPDPVTGQIRAGFPNNPQVPVEDVEISFFGGPRATLVNPDVCGTYSTRSEMSPWSAADPEHPLPAEVAVDEDAIAIDAPAVGAGACPTSKGQRPFAPTFEAGVGNPLAASHTAFTLRVTRPDGNQELAGVSVSLPPGLVATLKGIPACSEAAIAVASASGRTGKEELASPSCPAASRIGSTKIGAGAGPTPFYVGGDIYLTGPYKGAPIGLAFVVPAVAGPFDLGVQVVRTALRVDPKTAQVTAVSDPIPQILEGVPLGIRDVRVNVDRTGFTLNPSSCEAMAVSGLASGGSGASVALSNRFQVGGCNELGFKPKLRVRLRGGTRRAAYQRLEVNLAARPGDANIARASVTLPHSAFLAQEHIRTICTRVQFAADACPTGSIYGSAEATTPLLDGKLTGPVYLRSSDNPLPDLVVALRGPENQPVEVELAGRTDSINEGLRNTFDLVPDAPVSSFRLRLFGGQKSLIVNSRNLCSGTQRATVRMTGQNGKQWNFRPVVGNDCRKGRKNSRKQGRS